MTGPCCNAYPPHAPGQTRLTAHGLPGHASPCGSSRSLATPTPPPPCCPATAAAGFCGIAARLLGAGETTLTDLKDMLPLLTRNADLARAAGAGAESTGAGGLGGLGGLVVAELEWTDPVGHINPPFDVVLCEHPPTPVDRSRSRSRDALPPSARPVCHGSCSRRCDRSCGACRAGVTRADRACLSVHRHRTDTDTTVGRRTPATPLLYPPHRYWAHLSHNLTLAQGHR